MSGKLESRIKRLENEAGDTDEYFVFEEAGVTHKLSFREMRASFRKQQGMDDAAWNNCNLAELIALSSHKGEPMKPGKGA